jgi:hypothetical protein
MRNPVRAEILVALPLWALAALVVVLHLGVHSPYTYAWTAFGGDIAVSTLEGQHVNPDALSIWPLTVGFSAPCGIAYHAPNVLFPFHALCASVFVTLTGSYMLGQWLLNGAAIALLVWALTRACLARGYSKGAVAVAGVLVVTTPWIACYAGQPLHYLFAGCVSGCVVLAALEMARAGDRNPWRWGALVAVLTLTYDWYVFVAALAIYALAYLRFTRPRDALVFLGAGFAPTVLWHGFLSAAGGDQLSTRVAHTFLDPIRDGYVDLLSHPIGHALDWYMLPHVGLDIGARAVLDAVGWPLALATVVFAWRLRRSTTSSPGTKMTYLLLGLYVAEQAAVALLDVENSPRRALPAVCAVLLAAAWIAARAWSSLPSRVALVALALVSVATSLSDRLTDNPAIQLLDMGEVVRGEPKLPAILVDRGGDPGAPTRSAALPADDPVPLGTFRPVCGRLVDQSQGRGAYAQKLVVREARPADASNKTLGQRLAEFAAAQALLVALGAALLVPLKRVGLVPRYAPHAAGAALLVSYVVRLW